MSTRSIIVITGLDNRHNSPQTYRFYKHSDGYPSHTLDVIYHAINDAENVLKGDRSLSPTKMHTDLLAGKLIGHGTSQFGMGVKLEHESPSVLKPADYGEQEDLEFIYVIDTTKRSISIYGGGYLGQPPVAHLSKGELSEKDILRDEKETKDLMNKIKSLGFKFIHKEKVKPKSNLVKIK